MQQSEKKPPATHSTSSGQRREISAGFIVYQRTPEGPKFLVLYHGHNYWNFPKGKIENEERSLEAAYRETREETGLSSGDLKSVPNFKAYERFYFRRLGKAIFKVVIFYLAETRNRTVRVSDEHEGYGWFLYPEAKRVLGKHKDSQKVLEQSYAFLRRGRTHSDHHRQVRKYPRPERTSHVQPKP